MAIRAVCDKCGAVWSPGDTEWLSVDARYVKPDMTRVVRRYHFCDACSGPVKTQLQPIEQYVGD